MSEPPSERGPAARTGERGHLSTERALSESADLDRLDAADAVALVLRVDRAVHDALEAAAPEMARAVELVAARLVASGRLFYVGAGTSGRLAALDAAELPPTFLSDPREVQAIVAGGPGALLRAVEGAEDDRDAARAEIDRREVDAGDVVMGITAGGTTPFVHAAIERARERGAATVFLACVPFRDVPDSADVSIRLSTGPEVLAGSTRLKAGTATKIALNTLSTLVMVRMGRVYGNRMVDVDARGNAKLVDRAERLVMELVDTDRAAARALLEDARGRVKLAVVMGRLGLDAGRAQERLEAAGGYLRRALDEA